LFSEARPGKACDAGFDITFKDFSITVVMLVHNRDGSHECGLLTWCQKPRFRRTSPKAAYDAWARVCAAIETILRGNPRITSLLRLTKNEDEARFKKPQQLTAKLPFEA